MHRGQEILGIALMVLCFGTMLNDVWGRKIHLNQEDEELEQKLKILNKPYVKSIKAESGDVFDCVDVNKQPAFDNPLLKDHKILTSPTFLTDNIPRKSSSEIASEAQLPRLECPVGTVPIRRTTREELRNYQEFMGNYQNLLQNNGTTPSQKGSNTINIFRALRFSDKGTYNGGKAMISIFAPQDLGPEQQSAAYLTVKDDKNSFDNDHVGAGWLVAKKFFPDFQPRFVSMFNVAGKGGCINMLCPGFVQQHPSIALGSVFPSVSEYQGNQYFVSFEIRQDGTTGAWWVLYGEGREKVGYWPKELFGYMAQSAAVVHVGGVAVSPANEASPQMGSGHFPTEGMGGAAFARDIHAISKDVLLQSHFVRSLVEHTECYGLGKLEEDLAKQQIFFFGGPGGCASS